MMCPIEVFTGLRAHSRFIRTAPLRRYREMKVLDENRGKKIVNIDMFHAVLEEMHKEVLENNRLRRSRAEQIHNAKTNIVPINIAVGDYVMIRTKASRQHKLQSR